MPHFEHHFRPRPEALNFTQHLGNPQPRLAKKGAILEAQGLTMIFVEIRQHHGQSIAVWGGPFSKPNRG